MTGTLNVVGNIQLDVLASPVMRLPAPGGDDVIDHIAVRPAGAAGNVSLALAALGVQHRLFGAVGDDYAGRWVAQELGSVGLDRDLLVVSGGETGISIAVEAPDRERAFLTAHGVLTDYTLDAALLERVIDCDLLLLTGYFSMPGLRGPATHELLEAAHGRGSLVAFDTGWDPDNWLRGGVREVLDLLELVDIFLPNEPEALALTGEATAEDAAEALGRMFGGWAVIKLGERGVIASGPEGRRLRIPAPSVGAKDTTGAGDSLAAGMLGELARGASMREALELGVRVASTVVGRESRSRYPSRDELLPPVPVPEPVVD